MLADGGGIKQQVGACGLAGIAFSGGWLVSSSRVASTSRLKRLIR
jgi:hypothetical protein